MPQTILAVFPTGEDRTELERIFGQDKWRVRFAWGLEEAQAVLRGCTVTVVVSESRLPDGRSWKDLLAELQAMPEPRPLIVADRLADDRLWAEVLNLGGYDLLMKPFDAREVVHTVSIACVSRRDAPRRAGTDAKPLQSEAGGLS